MSDDYEFDDLVLDEDAIAALDNAEKSFFAANEPPTKKRKVSRDSGDHDGLHRTRPSLPDDDMPDVSINPDGSYSLKPPVSTGRPAPAKPTTSLRAPLTLGRVAASSSSSTLPQRPSATRPIIAGQSSAAPRYTSVHPRVPNPQPTGGTSAQQPQSDLWKSKFEDLTQRYEKMSSDLKEATTKTYSRDGELAILRRNMEKSTKGFETQISALRHAKEEAEAREKKMQKEMKDEIERIKTQFLFKQHELEASARKAPGTAKTKRIMREIPATPLPPRDGIIPSSIAPKPRASQETPMRPPPPPRWKSPKKPGRAASRSPEKKTLPGFHNAFTSSTPSRPSASQAATGKGKEAEEEADFWAADSPEVRKMRSKSQSYEFRPPVFPPPDMDFPINDVQMDIPFGIPPVATEVPDPPPAATDVVPLEVEEELDVPYLADWRQELSHLVIHHAMRLDDISTLQMLLKVDETSLPEHFRESFTGACSLLLKSISIRDDEYPSCAYMASTSFITLLNCFNGVIGLIDQLVAVFHLLSLLIFSLPDFSTILLSVPPPGAEGSWALESLHDLVLSHITPAKIKGADEVGIQIMDLLQSLSWNIQEECADKLASLFRRSEFLSTLLHGSLPCTFLQHVVKSLTVLSTSSTIANALLSPSLNDQPKFVAGEDPTIVRITHIEFLMGLLIAYTGDDKEQARLKAEIIQLFGVLSIKGERGPEVFNSSPTVLPGLMQHLGRLSSIFWDHAEPPSDAPLDSNSAIAAIHHTLVLIHFLVICTDSVQNFRQRIQSAPHRLFNGITHMFFVTFGRLSYAEPPDWLVDTQRDELKVLQGIAQQIMEALVVGPDADSVWDAFHFDEAGSDDGNVDEEFLDIVG